MTVCDLKAYQTVEKQKSQPCLCDLKANDGSLSYDKNSVLVHCKLPGSEWTAEEGEEWEGPGNLQLVVVLNEMAREAPKNFILE